MPHPVREIWPRWIAHRGGGYGAPENTLAGVGLAASRGFSAIEVDVRLAADGQPVVIHDDTLLRTTGRPGRVDEFAAVELSRMRASAGFELSAYEDETIPELGMLLIVAARHRMRVNLELKGEAASAGALVSAVAALLERLDWALVPGAVLLSAFEPALLLAARARLPLLPRALLSTCWSPAVLQRALALGCQSLNLAAEACQPEAVLTSRAAGLPVWAWTVNERSVAAALIALGVSSLFTDRLEFGRWVA